MDSNLWRAEARRLRLIASEMEDAAREAVPVWEPEDASKPASWRAWVGIVGIGICAVGGLIWFAVG